MAGNQLVTPLVTASILVSYVSLLIELTILRVPSVASSLSILSPTTALVSSYSAKYRRFLNLGILTKLLLFGAPLLVVYGIFSFPLLAIFYGPNLLGDYMFVPTPISNALGITLIFLGRLIAFASMLTIRHQNDQAGDSFQLQTSGMFRWSRNPGLVGMYLFAVGIWIVVPSASMLAGIVFYVVYMDFKVRMEEDFLKNRFGKQYVDYQLRTSRYVP